MESDEWRIQKRIAARNFFYEFQHLALKLIPNDQVDEYVEKIRHQAAVKIQKTWRGFINRKRYVNIKPELKRNRAAVIIQRAVREWLYRKSLRFHRGFKVNRINESNIKRIELDIARWNEENKDLQVSYDDESLQKRHGELCSQLTWFYRTSLNRSYDEQRTEALCTQIEAISSLVQQLPALAECDNADLSIFNSKIPSEAKIARIRHKKEMHQKDPWWKKLEQEIE